MSLFSNGPSSTTTSISNSNNVTNTINRTFDNSGNAAIYINSPGAGNSAPATNTNQTMILAIAAAVVGGYLLLKDK